MKEGESASTATLGADECGAADSRKDARECRQEEKKVSFCDAGGAGGGGSLPSRAASSEKTENKAKCKGKLVPVRKSTTYRTELEEIDDGYFECVDLIGEVGGRPIPSMAARSQSGLPTEG